MKNKRPPVDLYVSSDIPDTLEGTWMLASTYDQAVNLIKLNKFRSIRLGNKLKGKKQIKELKKWIKTNKVQATLL